MLETASSMNLIPTPYQLRARFCGVLDFACPWCAQICRVRITRKTFKVRCTGKDCRRWFGLGLLLHVLPRAGNGGSIPPDDYLIPTPVDPMPEARLNEWHRGEPMHQVEEEPPLEFET
jgi:hypothetical protein